MRPTIKQIAERCKLSISTVSHVLGKRGDAYSPATREKIWKAAEALGYRPNSVARAMREGKFGTLALLLSARDACSQLPSALLDGIVDGAAEADLGLTLAKLPDPSCAEQTVPKILREHTADGLIVHATHSIPGPMRALLDGYKLPTVWIHAKREFDCVRPDEFDAGYRATQWLYKRGHRDIVFVEAAADAGSPVTREGLRERLAGYTQAMQALGLNARPLPDEGFGPLDARADLARAWMAHADRPAAVIVSQRATGQLLARTALESGLAMPDTFEVLEFADAQPARDGLPVTTILQPWRAIGRAAVRMALEKINAPGTALPAQTVPCRMPGEAAAPTDTATKKTKAAGR